MKLSDFPTGITGELFRDGDFENIGMLYQEKPQNLCPLADAHYLENFSSNKSICALITTKDIIPLLPTNIGIWVSENPLESFFQLHKALMQSGPFYGEDTPSRIDESCTIASTAHIADQNINMMKNVMVGSGAQVLGRTEIGSDSVISTNVLIGGEGFEVKTINGISKIITHAGSVIIGENVEIQPFTSIDRGLFNDQTSIGNNVKIDSFVHIAHNAVIKDNVILASSVKIMGSALIGENVFISLGALVNNRVSIGNNSFIGPGEVVTQDVPPNSILRNGKIHSK